MEWLQPYANKQLAFFGVRLGMRLRERERHGAAVRWVKTKQRKSTCGEDRSGGLSLKLRLPTIVVCMYLCL